MFSCPSCGGNLKFDIPSQQLICEFCKSGHDPYAFDSKTKDAEESRDFEVTIFTCPQCGGEIMSTDNTAAGFCSFCGASTVLYSRISNEKRPGYIIPFQKTKEDCRQSYAKLMQKAIFAPKEFKDPARIDGFRGIYMPYWAYYVTQKGPVAANGEKSHRRGDYIITDHFKLTGEVDAYYKGFSHDASSSFYDSISEAIAPYDVKGMKPFTPAFFSGFYADTADVPAERYRQDAEQRATEMSRKKLLGTDPFRGHGVNSSSLSPAFFHTKTESIDSAMFPVWFMSYRSGDRVAYATINGQTGKPLIDIPVDKRKYALGSLLLAIPIFAVLCLFLTLMPRTLLILSAVIGIVACVIFATEINSIKAKEQGIPEGEKHNLGLICTIVTIVGSAAVYFLAPVSDLYYYACVALTLLAEVIMFMDIISYHNVLSTRKLPQFERTGGDDRG